MKQLKLKYFLIFLLLSILGLTTIDFIRISRYEIVPKSPKSKIPTKQDQVYFELVHGKENIDWNPQLDGTLEMISGEYDCADFRLVNLIRILYEFENKIPKNTLTKIEDTLFNFRYWWNDPGENSMCYWSENHQILFASAEYLIGKKYDEIVFKTGLTGEEHMQRARQRILDWLEMRWKYGFTEFYSEVYYKEDIGALINIIDFAEEQELVTKAGIILDLLFYDVASQNFKGVLASVSGRAYQGNRKGGPGKNLGGLTNYYWGDGKKINPNIMYGMMTTDKYVLPPVLIDIAKDTSDVVLKQCNGLDIVELDREGYFGTDNRSMMMQWGMESFTNQEIVRNTMQHTRKNNMFSNEFIHELKVLDYTLIRLLKLESAISRFLDPQSNGVAIQKGNTYTYKTNDYSLYSVQNYHPGTYGDQQHVAGMNVGTAFSVFHTHPALKEEVEYQSPNYWVGYGHLPHVSQDGNVSLAIYNIPDKKGKMEMDLLDFTYAYFPKELFDTVIINNQYALGKNGKIYCALIGSNPLSFKNNENDNLIQKGKKTFWIMEAGSKKEDNSFGEFCQRILNNTVEFDTTSLELRYVTNDKEFLLQFGKGFMLNKAEVDTEYKRFDSPYSQTEIKPDVIDIEFNGKSLHLDFYNLKRVF